MRWCEIVEDREPFVRGDTIVFFAGGARVRLTAEDGVLYMDKVFTQPEQRGQGDARKAIGKALQYADQQAKTVTLVAIPDQHEDLNRLKSFYASLGFRPDSDSPGEVLMTRPAKSG